MGKRGPHHARIDHGGVLRQHGAPAVALDVDEAEQLGVSDVFARHVPSVGG